jgi:Trk K+ transport system NAD-binding subunit
VPLAILFGLGRYGSAIATALHDRGWRVLAVDINPELAHRRRGGESKIVFGDAEDPEFIATLPLQQAQWVISTARQTHVNRSLIHALRGLAYDGHIAIAAEVPAEVPQWEDAGADLVLMPFADAAREAADRIVERGFLQPSAMVGR